MFQKIITFFTFLFLTIFPLAFDNYYFNITITKYKIYCFLCVAIFLSALCCTVIQKFSKSSSVSACRTTADLLMILFVAENTVSCLFSPWRSSSFTGADGKYVGLVFILMAGGLYYGITRYGTDSLLLNLSFPSVLILTSTMAVIQFCGYDIFGFYKNMAEGFSPMYLSTFGHIDVFAAFLCVYLPVCMYLFCFSEKKFRRILFAAGCFFGFLGVFASNSDSSYIGMGISILILCVLCTSSYVSLMQFGMLLFLLSCAVLALKALLTLTKSVHRDLSALTALVTSWHVVCVLILCSAVVLIAGILGIRKKAVIPKKIPFLSAVLFLLLFAAMLFCFLWFSIFDRTTSLGWLSNYLRFSPHWGSDRGYVWNWCFQLFCSGSLWTKCFGSGPDTTTLLLDRDYGSEMYETLGVYYASAHNEYLNYLITIGILGLVLYLALLILSIIRCFQKRHSELFYGAAGIALISYAAMAVVNISQPITMPFLFLLIALANRRTSSSKTVSSLK